MLKMGISYLNENGMGVYPIEEKTFEDKESLLKFINELEETYKEDIVNWIFNQDELDDMYLEHLFCGDDGIVSISYELI